MAKRQPLDVKELRAKHGISQVALARRLWQDDSIKDKHHTVLTISRWENGHQTPSLMTQANLRRVDEELQREKDNGKDSRVMPRTAAHGPTRKPLRKSTEDTADAKPQAPRARGIFPSMA